MLLLAQRGVLAAAPNWLFLACLLKEGKNGTEGAGCLLSLAALSMLLIEKPERLVRYQLRVRLPCLSEPLRVRGAPEKKKRKTLRSSLLPRPAFTPS